MGCEYTSSERPDNTARMRFVCDSDGVVLFAQLMDTCDRGDIAIHAEDRIGDNKGKTVIGSMLGQ